MAAIPGRISLFKRSDIYYVTYCYRDLEKHARRFRFHMTGHFHIPAGYACIEGRIVCS